jgi:hypothetical protein
MVRKQIEVILLLRKPAWLPLLIHFTENSVDFENPSF